ncbi:DUF4400 domain-containing protein [Roseateles chitinivorans]|uniref:DUF4400 domain-containing protein n=1 Tax=Roseateles chitinivorans TaxID=2917965 RepID=UPI003D67DFDB
MIRAVTVTCLVTVLLLVLYLPSSRPPQHFLERLRLEHDGNAALWGIAIADRILDRALTLQGHARVHSPVPSIADAPAPAAASAVAPAVAPAVAREMARVNARLFDNPYFRSIDALLVLAQYRFAALLEWWPRTWVVALALVLDALLERSRKAKEFRHHDPERFALFASLAILVLCASVVAMVWPGNLPPFMWAVVPTAIAALVARAVSHFHRRPF